VKLVDLNVDIGEGFPNDADLLQFASSANVCCGEHAGSIGLTHATVELCRERGIRIGAHPGLPDRQSMGRRAPTLSEVKASTDCLVSQVKRVEGAAYVKPHGAFYNLLVDSTSPRTDLVVSAWEVAIQYYESGYPLMLLNEDNFRWATRKHFPTAHLIIEGFADRAYLPDGTLVPRTQPGAILDDPELIRRQVLTLAKTVNSICLHGDTPNCLELAELVYRTLVDADFEVGY